MQDYPIKRTLLTVCLFILAALEYGIGQTPESLDRLIEQCSPPATGPMRSLMDEHFPKWEGARTVIGLNLILDKHMTPGKSADVNITCANFLRRMELPKVQIATAMMERARLESTSEAEPWRVVYLLRQMEKMIDREEQGKEVVPFIASFLNDKRPTEPQHRGPESVPRQPRRVCDGATSALINFMEETGICQKYDVRFGNPGGEGTWEKREEVMRAVVQVLQDKAFLSADFWTTLPPVRLPMTSATQNNNPTTSTQSSSITQVKATAPTTSEVAPPPVPRESPASSTPWGIIVVLLMAGSGLLWLLLERRK